MCYWINYLNPLVCEQGESFTCIKGKKRRSITFNFWWRNVLKTGQRPIGTSPITPIRISRITLPKKIHIGDLHHCSPHLPQGSYHAAASAFLTSATDGWLLSPCSTWLVASPKRCSCLFSPHLYAYTELTALWLLPPYQLHEGYTSGFCVLVVCYSL